MSAFGPFYPPTLQASVNHAERLARLLEREEVSRAGRGRGKDPWWVGRAAEIECVVELAVFDWRRGVRTADVAATAVDAYLAELHQALSPRLGVARAPCCSAPCATVVAPPGAPVTAPGSDTVERLLANLACRPEGP
jgi:hypothetical protein